MLLYIGRIHPKKGLAELIEGFAQARLKGWKMVLAGWDDGGHLQPLRQRVSALGLSDSIILPGPLYGEDKQAALANAHAFVLPSHSEGLPMSVLEAWAHGLPVLMTQECNLPEGFSQGAAIRISQQAGNIAEALSSQLCAMDGAALGDMGAKGKALVEQGYSWQQIARDHVAVYRWMTGASEQAPPCVQFAGVMQ